MCLSMDVKRERERVVTVNLLQEGCLGRMNSIVILSDVNWKEKLRE